MGTPESLDVTVEKMKVVVECERAFEAGTTCQTRLRAASGYPALKLPQSVTVWEQRYRYWRDICGVYNQ